LLAAPAVARGSVPAEEAARQRPAALRHPENVVGPFDFGWVAGVELATASEPPALRPRISGRRRPDVAASRPEL